MELDECDRLFTKFEAASSFSERCFALEPVFDKYELINVEFGRGGIFWRARSIEDHKRHAPGEMSYPPVEKTKAGRLNDPNAPCLYTATTVETALHEIGAKEGDLVQLVGYRVLVEKPLRIALVGELLHVYKMGYMRHFGEDPGGTIKKILNSHNVNTAKRLIYIDTYLSQTMADTEARSIEYVKSRSIASMIYRMHEIDGIIYPSVRDNFGMNLTLRANVADEKVHPVTCILVRVGKIRRHGFIEYETLEDVERIDEENKFVWKTARAYPHRRFFNLSKEEYEFVLRHRGNPEGFEEMLSLYNTKR